MPSLSPRAAPMASPRTIPTSSIVWCSSTCRSPLASMASDTPPWFGICSSMWSKNGRPVEMCPEPPMESRSNSRAIFVSLVLRTIRICLSPNISIPGVVASTGSATEEDSSRSSLSFSTGVPTVMRRHPSQPETLERFRTMTPPASSLS